MMYEKFFSGEAVNIRRALKKEFASTNMRKLLSQIFKVVCYIHDLTRHACTKRYVAVSNKDVQ